MFKKSVTFIFYASVLNAILLIERKSNEKEKKGLLISSLRLKSSISFVEDKICPELSAAIAEWAKKEFLFFTIITRIFSLNGAANDLLRKCQFIGFLSPKEGNVHSAHCRLHGSYWYSYEATVARGVQSLIEQEEVENFL